MEPDPLPFIRPENSLLISIKKDKIVNMVVSKMQALPNIKTLKEDLEVLKFACMLVENKVSNKVYQDKINKKDIVILAYEKVFGGAINKDILSNQIDFLYNNENVEVVHWFFQFISYIKNWFMRKVVY